MKRRKSSAEFKRKVVVEAIRGQQTAREIAARHGLNPNQVARWKSEGMDGLLEAFRRDGAGKAVRAFEGLSLSRKCGLAGAGRSSMYHESAPADEGTLMLRELVDRLYMDRPYYGTRRAGAHLRRLGHDVGRDRARALMASVNWRTVHPGPRTSKPQPGHRVYPYLLGGLDRIAPGDVICSDITYIPVSGGYFHLVAVMDWASRYVLSWELDNTMEVGLKRERAEGGAGAPRGALDLEHRPREPVHERGVPWCPAGGGGADQHGWPGAMDRQPAHRAAVALDEVREGLPGGYEGRAPCAPGGLFMDGVLQPRASARGAGLGDDAPSVRAFFSPKSTLSFALKLSKGPRPLHLQTLLLFSSRIYIRSG